MYNKPGIRGYNFWRKTRIMKTVLRLLKGENQGYRDIENPFSMIPSKGDYIVYSQNSYNVLYLEYDYDTNTVYIVVT